MKKQSKTAQIRALLEAGKSVKEVAAKLKVKPTAVYQVRHKMSKDVGPTPEEKLLHAIFNEKPTVVDVKLADIEPADIKPAYDPVNHPTHYKAGGIETIDFIEAKQLGYHLGNVIKYITRAPYKGGMQDLLKAQWYLNRAIEKGEV